MFPTESEPIETEGRRWKYGEDAEYALCAGQRQDDGDEPRRAEGRADPRAGGAGDADGRRYVGDRGESRAPDGHQVRRGPRGQRDEADLTEGNENPDAKCVGVSCVITANIKPSPRGEGGPPQAVGEVLRHVKEPLNKSLRASAGSFSACRCQIPLDVAMLRLRGLFLDSRKNPSTDARIDLISGSLMSKHFRHRQPSYEFLGGKSYAEKHQYHLWECKDYRAGLKKDNLYNGYASACGWPWFPTRNEDSLLPLQEAPGFFLQAVLVNGVLGYETGNDGFGTTPGTMPTTIFFH